MKNIKELIYAAVEENAVVFQELAGNILQARAYDAIESLRPEIGASMFGESSHMNGKDDEEDEEMEDEEDEDEEDDKKKSMKEALVGKQHEIDKNKNGKIDGHDFKLLRKKEVEGLEEMSDDERRKELDRFGKKAAQTHGYDHPSDTSKASSSAVKSELKAARKLVAGTAKPYRSPTSPANEEVEQIDEIGDTPRGKAALTNLASQRFGRARWAAGVHQALAGSERHATTTSPHSRLQDKDNTVAHKAAAKVGIKPHEVPSHNYDYDKKGGYGTKVADPAHKLADRNKPKMEEVEGLDELSTEKLLKYREAAKKDADVKNKAWDKKKLSDEGKYKLMNRETGTDQADQKIKRKTGSYRPGILARVGARLRNEEVEQIDEVDHPKNQADMLAHIMHQIQIAGHPVATDAQFRATTVGKDMSKIASLEPGEDMLQYATAQGGTVKK